MLSVTNLYFTDETSRFGYNDSLESFRIENELDNFEVGRVILEHKERYVIKTPDAEFDAELIGNLKYTAESSYGFPAVGDQVVFAEYDEGKALIHISIKYFQDILFWSFKR
jgi:ribosome biogenesis GTPase